MVNPDLTIFFIFGTILIAVLSIALILILIITTRRQIQTKLEKQKMQLKFEEDLLRTRMEVQEQALQNFSGEIHDGVGQDLSLARMQLNRLKPYITDPEGTALIKNYSELLKASIKNLRLLSHSLNTNLILQKGLEEAIESEIARVRNFTTLCCDYKVEGTNQTLSAEKELLIFRVFQETVQNVNKHAEASAVDVLLDYLPEQLILSIHDDGKGFVPVVSGKSTAGMGISNMHYRANMLKGKLEIESHPGDGTTVRLLVPYN